MDKRPLLDSLAGIDDLKKVIGEYNNAADRARELLTKMSDSLVENICSDPVSEIYRKLFDSEVVINTDETHARLVADSDNRNIHEIAPGFKDADKPCGGLGDKVVWRCILDVGKLTKKPCILVTNDFRKGDLGHSISNRLLFPRYELIDEYRRVSEGQSFHAVQLSTLIELLSPDSDAAKEIRQTEASPLLDALLAPPRPSSSGSVAESVLELASKGLRDLVQGVDSMEARAARSTLESMNLGAPSPTGTVVWQQRPDPAMYYSGNVFAPSLRMHPSYQPILVTPPPPTGPQGADS